MTVRIGVLSYSTSMIVNPRGIVVQRAGETREELLFHDIDLDAENPHWQESASCARSVMNWSKKSCTSGSAFSTWRNRSSSTGM
jgi:hypothetical protein